VIARLRYVLEAIGPERRQYIVTSNDEKRRFSRTQQRWVYASSKVMAPLSEPLGPDDHSQDPC